MGIGLKNYRGPRPLTEEVTGELSDGDWSEELPRPKATRTTESRGIVVERVSALLPLGYVTGPNNEPALRTISIH